MSCFKVLVVDDSSFMRKVFSDFISADPSFEVVATAANGMEAVERTIELAPDVITMDLEMPAMNGLEALKRIMALRPTPVIMLSAVTDNGTRDTIRALQYGAVDFIRKPDRSVKLDIRLVGEQLREKLHVAVEMARSGNYRMLPAVEEKPDNQEEPQAIVPGERFPEPPAAAEPPQGEPERPSLAADPPASPNGTDRSGGPTAESPPKKPDSLRKKPAKSEPPPEDGLPRPAADGRSPPLVPKRAKPAPSAKTARDDRTGLFKEPPRSRSVQQPERLLAKRLPPAEPAGGAVRNKAAPAGKSAFEHLVAIGTSTGGPRALHEVLTNLPADFPAPVLIVQHMPPKFTQSLAQRLDSFSEIRVCEAQDGETVLSGTAYIAPGGKHMLLAKDPSSTAYRIVLSDEEPRSGHRPSVDKLFESLLGCKGLKRHIVVMTGMGSDGAKGMKALREDGAETTIAEAEQTCVVYGMPRSAVELGAASHVLRLQEIAPALVREVSARNK